MTCPHYEELELRSLDFKSHTPHHYMIHKAFLNIISWNILLPLTAFSWLWWVFFFSSPFYVSNRAGHPEAEWIHTWQCITVGTLEVAGACMLSTNYHTCFSTTTNTGWHVPNIPPTMWNTSVPKIHKLFQHLIPYLPTVTRVNTEHSSLLLLSRDVLRYACWRGPEELIWIPTWDSAGVWALYEYYLLTLWAGRHSKLVGFLQFLNSGTTDIWGYRILCSGGCPVHLKMFSSIPGFYLLNTSSTHSSAWL